MANPGTTKFPATVDAWDRIDPSAYENAAGYEHDLVHNQAQDAIEAVEDVIGTNSGTGVLTNFTVGDLAAKQDNDTLGSPGIVDGTISGTDLRNVTIGTSAITDGTVASAVIDECTIGTPAMSAGTVSASVIANCTIGTPALSAGTVDQSIIANCTIGTPAISSGTALAITLGTPTIGDLRNATHDHSSAAEGGDSVSHTDLDDIGTVTHANVDVHIAATGTAVHALKEMALQVPSGVEITGGTIGDVTMGTPTIGDFTSSTHDHSNAAGGGEVSHTSLGDIGTVTHANVDVHIAAEGTAVHGLKEMALQAPATVQITGGTIDEVVMGTPTVTGGDFANVTVGTSAITGGTATSLTLGSPTISGTVGGTTGFLTYPEVDGTAQNPATAMWNANALLGNIISEMTAGEDGMYLKYDNTNGSAVWDTPAGAGDMAVATYDTESIAEQLVGTSATQTLTNKTLTSPVIANATVGTSAITGGTVAGATINTSTLTSPVINTGFSGSGTASGAEINTGTADTKIVTPLSIAESNVVITDKTQTLSNKTLDNLKAGKGAELTISAGGGIAVTHSYHQVDTLGGTATTDDLVSITGAADGDILILRTADSGRDITVKNGNPFFIGADRVLDSISDTITLLNRGGNLWLLLSYADNT